ncbi:hypothetical protein BCR34DRAFT_596242 [Clohesyomyces aquaticus]|uniref:Uncharacterized protein n=1 Tax=Clohesyomyces aquaticus TaxID=1231657 RepID=A0A1Y2A717_9PLEO|nr:hypothetical protein BCR34DRAFT_596242 [Clohesyomyces aquaticus]
MKLTILALLSLTTLSVAENCRPGIWYCGYNLLRRGNYMEDIKKELASFGRPLDGHHIYDSRFQCTHDYGIFFRGTCYAGKCNDGGEGKDDNCAWGVLEGRDMKFGERGDDLRSGEANEEVADA